MIDPFWDVRAREEQEELALSKAVAGYDAELDLMKKAEAMRLSSGYADFVKAIERLRDLTTKRLVGDDRTTNDGLRELRGEAKALGRVLELLSTGKAAELLEARRAQMQNALDEAKRRRPQPKPEVIS